MSETQNKLSRRHALAGVTAAAAAVTAAAVLPRTETAPADAAPAAAPSAAPGQDEGYRLTAHVQRYYQTARI